MATSVRGRCRRCGKSCEVGAGHCAPCKAFRAEYQRRRYATRAVRKLTREVELVNAMQRAYRLGYQAAKLEAGK